MRYKLLGRSGLRVSELCLGTMTFGEDWGWGASKQESQCIFERFVAAGGNFIDTSNNYTEGSSECYIGEFIAAERERYVVGTKYSLSTRKDDPNGGGNQRKNLMQSVNASLKRLKTDYIDLLWLHMWDFMTPVDEVMRGLDDLVRAGTVLYIGISDTPAWVIAQANTLADLRGWSRFVALQAPYSLLDRAVEAELWPMGRSFGMGLLAWGALEGGVLTGKYSQPSEGPRRYGDHSVGGKQQAIVDALGAVASEVGRTPAQVALAWVRQQPGGIIPILGARTAAQLQENMSSLELELSHEHLQRLSQLSQPQFGFPHDFLHSDHVHELIFGQTYALIDH